MGYVLLSNIVFTNELASQKNTPFCQLFMPTSGVTLLIS